MCVKILFLWLGLNVWDDVSNIEDTIIWTWLMKNVKVLIPAAGRGERFLSFGYDFPKPLIMVHNKTMIEWAISTLGFPKENVEFIVITRKYQNCDWNDQLTNVLQNIDYKINEIQISEITEGPACTALLSENMINKNEPLVICNCDQILRWNGAFFLNSVIDSIYDGVVVTYEESKPKNSYAKIDRFGNVVNIAEKQVISNVSLNGVHFWNKGSYFVESAKKMIANNERYNNEFYVGPSYNEMIKSGLKVGIYHIPRECHIPIGIPADLEHFLESFKNA